MVEQIIAARRIIPAVGDAGAGTPVGHATAPTNVEGGSAGDAGVGRHGWAATGRSSTITTGYVVISDGRIAAVARGRPPRPPDVDLTDGVLVPGFVDLQVNGYFGEELQNVDPRGWWAVTRRLPETGTTAFLATFITAPLPELVTAVRDAARLLRGSELHDPTADPQTAVVSSTEDTPGTAGASPGVTARVLGLHLEGPFISPHCAGAHNVAWITPPSRAAVDRLLEAGSGLVRVVTLAPEVPDAIPAIHRLTAAGVVASVGHSDATARQVAAAADAGARMVTHVFNAQRGLHHREPGVAGEALADPRLAVGLIADLHHVAAPVCRIVFAAAVGRVVLVTDAASCAGMPPGRYLLGGEPIELRAGGGAPPVRADGTLAGSALRMDAAVANVTRAGVPLAAAVTAATRVPADLVGRPDLGRIAPGAWADLVWLDDDLRTRATWVAGRLAYRRDGEASGGRTTDGT